MRIKKVRQSRIILLIFGSILLGRITLGVTAYQGINLINQKLIYRHEQEGKKYIAAFVLMQVRYRLTSYKFANSFKELEVAIVKKKLQLSNL